MKRAFAALVLVLAVPSCKKGLGSGFEGEITLHTTRGSDSQDMIIKTKQEKLRFETNANGKALGDGDPVEGAPDLR